MLDLPMMGICMLNVIDKILQICRGV